MDAKDCSRKITSLSQFVVVMRVRNQEQVAIQVHNQNAEEVL